LNHFPGDDTPNPALKAGKRGRAEENREGKGEWKNGISKKKRKGKKIRIVQPLILA